MVSFAQPDVDIHPGDKVTAFHLTVQKLAAFIQLLEDRRCTLLRRLRDALCFANTELGIRNGNCGFLEIPAAEIPLRAFRLFEQVSGQRRVAEPIGL